MLCPKCRKLMETLEFGTDLRIARCTGCGGIFCKSATLQKLRDEWRSDAVLDKGSAALGARNNAILDIDCPECGTRMGRTKDHEQSHITLESCANCSSVFLDAGELTDMKSLTLMDQVRRLLARLGK